MLENKILGMWIISKRGATAVEYGLIVAAIAVAISVGILAFGDGLATIFGDSAAAVSQRP